jgi:hypothetical protein
MKKFLVLYMAPAAGMKEWMQKPEADRKVEEDKMKSDWGVWTTANGGMIKETAGAGKTKRVTKDGVVDVANDVMLYSMVEGDSTDAVAELFKDHPHLGIPGATIDVMPANALPAM